MKGTLFFTGLVIFILDLLVALAAFWLFDCFNSLQQYQWLALSVIIWGLVGVLTRKLYFGKYKKYRYAIVGLFVIDLLTGVLIFMIYRNTVSDFVPNNSIFLATGLIFLCECMLYYCVRLFVYRKIPYFYEEPPHFGRMCECSSISDENTEDEDVKMLFDYFEKNDSEVDNLCDIPFSDKVVILDTSNPELVLKCIVKHPSLVVHCKSLNDVRHINTLLSYSNYALCENGYLACCCVTSDVRKDKIMHDSPPLIARIIYSLDYFVHRVFSKLPMTIRLYYLLTKGVRRVLTKVEVLGRVYRAGFDVVKEYTVDDKFYIVAKKTAEPIRDDSPSRSMLIRLKRKGKGGKIIGVYKFRTMYSYSEYLQPYIYRKCGLCEGGKFANDFRVSFIGKALRKMWLDEFPMLINWLKGDLKLVGVRPLSSHYFSLYSKELQELRIKVKPGLLPPFYADMPKTLAEIQESEIRYIKSYLKNPIRTDWVYFWRCVNNIVFKGKRSK